MPNKNYLCQGIVTIDVGAGAVADKGCFVWVRDQQIATPPSSRRDIDYVATDLIGFYNINAGDSYPNLQEGDTLRIWVETKSKMYAYADVVVDMVKGKSVQNFAFTKHSGQKDGIKNDSLEGTKGLLKSGLTKGLKDGLS